MRFTKSIIALAPFVFAGLAASASAQTDVGVGGTVVNLNGGSQNIVLRVKNKTGRTAKDITFHIFHEDGVDVPNLNNINVTQIGNDSSITDDVVDDNGDGTISGPDEQDTSDSSPGTTASTILHGNSDVDNNETATVTIRFTGPLPEGAKIRVKFSEEIDTIHYDICMNGSMTPGELFQDEWGGGRALCLATIANGALPRDEAIGGFEIHNLGDLTDNGFAMLELPAPFEIVEMEVFPEFAFVRFQPPLLPGQCMDLLVGFHQDLTEGTGVGFLPLPAPPPCPGDFNGDGVVNTLDVIEFLSAWSAGC